jgi:hypothetical protein
MLKMEVISTCTTFRVSLRLLRTLVFRMKIYPVISFILLLRVCVAEMPYEL